MYGAALHFDLDAANVSTGIKLSVVFDRISEHSCLINNKFLTGLLLAHNNLYKPDFLLFKQPFSLWGFLVCFLFSQIILVRINIYCCQCCIH